jgi:ornithine carbamoyltransferase
MGVTYLDPGGSQIGHKESIKDTARVLGRMYDAIEYRGFAQSIVEDLRQVRGRARLQRPDRRIAPDADPRRLHDDGRALRQAAGEAGCCYLGDARNNMGNSLLLGGRAMGMDVRLCAPKALWPARPSSRRRARSHGGSARITLSDDPKAAVPGCDFVYTDVWVSWASPRRVGRAHRSSSPTRSTRR